jgi:hypothetical protein
LGGFWGIPCKFDQKNTKNTLKYYNCLCKKKNPILSSSLFSEANCNDNYNFQSQTVTPRQQPDMKNCLDIDWKFSQNIDQWFIRDI